MNDLFQLAHCGQRFPFPLRKPQEEKHVLLSGEELTSL